MPVRQKENIFILSIHIKLGIMAHCVEIEGSKVFGTTEGATGVTACSSMYHSNNIPTDLGGNFLQFRHNRINVVAKVKESP